MYAKVRNALACILTGVIIICLLTVTLTFGKFTKEESSGVDGSGDLSFTVSNQMEVKTVEELFVAIANGYSYVKIADSLENPLVVTSATVDVGSDLIIDLNGHDLQRNNRTPMLNITKNVRVTVIDSSKEQTGSLYNPVGSVLQIGGGTLTVSAGKFESGPRAEEYYNYSAQTGQYPTHGNVTDIDSFTGNLYLKTDGYKNPSTAILPVITPTITKTGLGNNTYYANGNIYLNEALSGYAEGFFVEDTYLYYSLDDDSVEPNSIYSQGSADFYYSYYTKKTITNGIPSYSGASATKEDDSWVGVTVYGYNKVIASAKNEKGTAYETNHSNFAAIKMLEGDLQVCGGEYVSNFGVDSAYCVYAAGGKMIVDDGTFYAVNEGVCVRCDFPKDSDDSLRITNGEFKSYHGDTIQMTDGTMTVTGGTFVKDSTAYTQATASKHNNSAVNITKGAITLTSTSNTPINFYLAGKYMSAIHCGTGAEIKSTGVNYEFGRTGPNNEDKIQSDKGGNNMGIYSEGGKVTVTSCVFIQPGNYSYGIFSLDSSASGSAQIDVRSSIFSLGGKRCIGIYANGGIINIGNEDDMVSQYVVDIDQTIAETNKGYPISTYTMFYLDHVANCYGIYVADQEKTANDAGGTMRTAAKINVYAGQFVVGSGFNDKNEYYAASEKPISFTGASSVDPNDYDVAWVNGQPHTPQQLVEHEEVWSAGVYLNQAGASVGLGRVRMITGGHYAAGIFVANGEVSKLYNSSASGQAGTGTGTGTGTQTNITAPTTVLFVGTTLRGYSNGGYDTMTTKNKWSYLYKQDSDYRQDENFMTYYDRIDSADTQYEYGIAAKGGKIDIGRIYINLRSVSSRGVFATGGGTADTQSTVNVDEFIADIDNMSWTKDKDDKWLSTVPDELSTTTMTIRNGNVNINNADLYTNGIGIFLNYGQLTFNGKVEMDSIHTSPIYITSQAMGSGVANAAEGSTTMNNLVIGEKAKVNITCTLKAGKVYNEKTQKYEENPTEPIPWNISRNNGLIKSYNGINIRGGSLIGNGELIVNFTGLHNDNQSSYDPYNMNLKSCAINVEKLENGVEPQVQLWHAHVTSNVGGGISVKGGNVTLGKATLSEDLQDKNSDEYKILHDSVPGQSYQHDGDPNNLITITTNGNVKYDKLLGGGKASAGGYDNWAYYPSQTGGPGIRVSDGDIVVRYGTYRAAQGNGILVSNGKATVYDGNFTGNNTGWDGKDTNGSGVASYYGFMLRGGGTLTIEGGTFTGFNGGAFVTGGVYAPITDKEKVTANIYGGTYKALGSGSGRTTNGFSIGYNATVTIGKVITDANYVPPTIAGYACGIAVEKNGGLTPKLSGMKIDSNAEKNVSVVVQSGTTVSGERDENGSAIWQGNSSAKLELGECTLQITYIYYAPSNFYNKIISGNTNNWSAITKHNVYAIKTEAPADTKYTQLNKNNSCNTTKYNIFRVTSKSLQEVNQELKS